MEELQTLEDLTISTTPVWAGAAVSSGGATTANGGLLGTDGRRRVRCPPGESAAGASQACLYAPFPSDDVLTASSMSTRDNEPKAAVQRVAKELCGPPPRGASALAHTHRQRRPVLITASTLVATSIAGGLLLVNGSVDAMVGGSVVVGVALLFALWFCLFLRAYLCAVRVARDGVLIPDASVMPTEVGGKATRPAYEVEFSARGKVHRELIFAHGDAGDWAHTSVFYIPGTKRSIAVYAPHKGLATERPIITTYTQARWRAGQTD